MSEANEVDSREAPAAPATADTGRADTGRPDTVPAVWPLAVLVALQIAALTIPGRIAPGTPVHFFGLMLGGAGSTLLILLWWFTRRRLPLRDRFVGFLLFAGLVYGFVTFLFHEYMVPMPTMTYVVPSLFLALVPLLAIAHVTGWRTGRFVTLAGVVAVLGAWTTVQSKGIDGDLDAGLAWRWSPTSEEQFLAEGGAEAVTAEASAAIEAGPGDWVGFRGPRRDGALRGATIAGDWSSAPPEEVWRRRVGPGWGSFTVVGGLLFTQEQRGEQEVVACYDAATGEPRWTNETPARFEESAAGPGPRATPTFDDGRLYTLGATGAMQCLDAANGEAVWRRDVTEDTSAELIIKGNWWGFASSPLLCDGADGRRLAIVYVATPHARDPAAPAPADAVIAYDAATGEPAWTGGVGAHGYGSPQLATLGGAAQVLVTSDRGLESLAPATGERLWFYAWDTQGYPRVVQPTLVGEDRVILATGYGLGTHAIDVAKGADGWTTETVWDTKKLKPYFNDLVHYRDHLYGFDGKFFTCLDARTGEVTWPRSVKRKAAFGHGQALLVEDAGLIVVVTEKTGEVVLIEANPETLVERGRITALEGKTWNHPVIAAGRLYVRNGAEMACYALAPAAEGVAAAR